MSDCSTESPPCGTVPPYGTTTGTFACQLASRGIEVTAVDPAKASLDVARGKPGAAAVNWLHGDATTLPRLSVDAAFMTANVAQVFLTDDDWLATLEGIRGALRRDGMVAFETRDRRAARGSDGRQRSLERWSMCQTRVESTSTLRFRERFEIEQSLVAQGFDRIEVRDAPDRPGREFVFVCRRAR